MGKGEFDELAEMRARARANDSQRMGGPASFKAVLHDGEDYGPDRQVPCAGCGEMQTISGWSWDNAKHVARALMNKGEAPLGENEITRCEPCADKWRAQRLEQDLALEEKINQLYRMAREQGEFVPEARRWLRANGVWAGQHYQWIEKVQKDFHEKQKQGAKPKARKL